MVGASLAAASLAGGLIVVDPMGLRSKGPESAAEVLPASTSAVVEFDVEPDLLQVAELATFAGKVKPLQQWAPPGDGGDLREKLWKSVAGPCAGVDYATKVKPWLGRKVAVATVDGSDARVWTVQVRDEQAARGGVAELASCGLVPDGVAVRDNFLVLAQDDATALRLVDEGRQEPLAQRAEYAEDTRRTAQSGLVKFWTTKQQLVALSRTSQADALTRSLGSVAPRLVEEGRAADWRSGAGVLRFGGGVPEVKLVVKSNQPHKASTTEMGLASLPRDSVLGFGISDGDEVLRHSWPQVQHVLARLGVDVPQLAKRHHLEAPGDVETVLGKDFKVSFSPAERPVERVQELPMQLQSIGRSRKSPDAVESIVQKSGVQEQGWQPARRRRTLALSKDPQRSAMVLRTKKRLTQDETFRSAYPKPEQAQVGVYANLQALGPIAVNAAPPALKPWVEALGAVGANAHNEDANYSVMRVAVTPRG
ncbi:MAG: DUF3352 domain-containing protein [Luteococcus sp.]|uniref:hypothetical protein n=1 Tax=Luteococcus sp. TaxID=1969402 RepID=UPI002647D813|nr:hypothetical protein [Luteococcus sp.]MDN5564056.1 DUF3352 domain-containing protein [Luteococcus sp.]